MIRLLGGDYALAVWVKFCAPSRVRNQLNRPRPMDFVRPSKHSPVEYVLRRPEQPSRFERIKHPRMYLPCDLLKRRAGSISRKPGCARVCISARQIIYRHRSMSGTRVQPTPLPNPTSKMNFSTAILFLLALVACAQAAPFPERSRSAEIP